jgi:hypothetical protein
MLRRLVPALIALVLVPAARADGPGVVSDVWGGPGVTSPGAPLRYVTIPTGRSTLLETVRRRDGAVVSWRNLNGSWSVPAVTVGGVAGGLTHDGRLLVLQATPLGSETRFLVLDVSRWLSIRRAISLRGDFAYDALSPGAATLYLIQHVPDPGGARYRVRAYDLRAGRLLPRVIADRRERGWTMSGYPVARATSPDGRWVYTLYRQADNYPFVHALDTATRNAVCIALPEPWRRLYRTDSNALYRGSLRLDGRRLLVADRPGADPRYALDTASFRVSEPGRAGGPPIALAGIGAGALLVAVALLVARRRGTRRGRAV